MLSQLVMTRVRHLLLTIVALFKKLLCCFSRRRRPSSAGAGPGDALSSVNVVRDSARYKVGLILHAEKSLVGFLV